MARDFIVPGHPIGDLIPDVGAEIGPIHLLTSVGHSELAAKRFEELCEFFIRDCAHAGVRLSPLKSHIEIGRFWKVSRKFRVESLDPSKYLCCYQRDLIAEATAELAGRP